ncbi:MAG: hypothetical protein JWM16_1530 [Verrucomicrobiales bacterium]|nr:hypothetical protein [Verrucomicrobiales bacterium]
MTPKFSVGKHRTPGSFLLVADFEEGVRLVGGAVGETAIGSEGVDGHGGPSLEVSGGVQDEGLVGFAYWGDLDRIVGEGEERVVPGEDTLACSHIAAGPNGASDAALVHGRVSGWAGCVQRRVAVGEAESEGWAAVVLKWTEERVGIVKAAGIGEVAA